MKNETEKVTAYVVKYAQTAGIQTVEAEICKGHGNNRFLHHETLGYTQYVHGEGKDWTLDRAQAVKLATAKVAKAIKSTEAKLAKLRKLRFE